MPISWYHKRIMPEEQKIKVLKNGPYEVSGKVPLSVENIVADENNVPDKWEKGKDCPLQENYRLCRCGKSKNKPYCDGSHIKTGFDGNETAGNLPYSEQAETIEGPELDLKDAQGFCASARFCHKSIGTWQLTENSDDPQNKKMAVESACNCPSGRLTAYDKKTGKPIEPEFTPSIGLVEDIPAGVSGPLWVRGGIQIESAQGYKYEKRNRVTLCRCGKSQNKPFCDGSHMESHFSGENK
jgi:CDGSH-type Zn-finger protein